MSRAAPVMLVTPYRDTAEVIRGVLSELGYDGTVEIEDAEAALPRLLERGRYRFVIADWAGGGLSLLQEMRTRTPLRSMPVLLMAAGASKEMVISAKAAGATDFIMKPFSIATLKRKLGTALQRSRLVDVIEDV